MEVDSLVATEAKVPDGLYRHSRVYARPDTFNMRSAEGQSVMPRFIAIPVSAGDAFYLQRDGLSLLVDGGRSRSGFADMFRNATGTNGVDVVICTHNDADHANGIIGFLESGLTCEEMWLPGRWLALAPAVFRPLDEVGAELATAVNEVKDLDNVSDIEQYAGQLVEIPAEGAEVIGEIPADGWPESYAQLVEDAESWEPLSEWLPYLYFQPAGRRRLLWSAIQAAKRIRKIATEAFHRGIRVRWFEFDTVKPTGGIPGQLEPVNARELKVVRELNLKRAGTQVAPGVILLCYLALTLQNKESLVFWSPPTTSHPGVLFTADSDLFGLSLASQSAFENAIATAPHHGSEANEKAYDKLANAAGRYSSSITWVRSDGRYSRRPCREYLNLSRNQRVCTLCRLAGARKLAVRLYSRKRQWVLRPPTVKCACC